MTRRSFTELLLLTILMPTTAIPDTCQGQLWRGARELRWVQLPGVLGVAIGAIAIGTTVMSTSITTIILTGTTTRTSARTLTAAKLARATSGSTMRNTGEMHPMEAGKRPISTVARLADRVGHGLVLEQELVLGALPQALVIALAVLPQELAIVLA